MECLIDTSVIEHGSAGRALQRVIRRTKLPGAIFALKNSATIAVFEVLQEQKMAVPKKIALLGYDDFELAETVRPSVSVIQQPIEDLAAWRLNVYLKDCWERRLGAAGSGTSLS